MLAILIMLWMALRGIIEGIVMTQFSDPMVDQNPTDHQEGARLHRWFRWYHWLCIARDGMLVAVVTSVHHFADISNMIFAGAVVLGWQLFEAAYHYTRYRKIITGQENVLGVWNLTNSADVWLLNSFRVLIGAGLILWGVQ